MSGEISRVAHANLQRHTARFTHIQADATKRVLHCLPRNWTSDQAQKHTNTRSLIAPTGAKGVFLPQHHGNRRWSLQLGSSRRLLTACLPALAEEPGTAALCPPRTHLYPHLLFSIKGRGGRGSCRGLRAGHPPPKRLISLPASGAQVSQLGEDEHLPSSRAGAL